MDAVIKLSVPDGLMNPSIMATAESAAKFQEIREMAFAVGRHPMAGEADDWVIWQDPDSKVRYHVGKPDREQEIEFADEIASRSYPPRRR